MFVSPLTKRGQPFCPSPVPADQCLARTGGLIKKQPAWRLLLLATGSLCTVVFTVSRMQPVFVQREPVVAQILRHQYVDSATIHAPWLNSPTRVALQTPQFLAD